MSSVLRDLLALTIATAEAAILPNICIIKQDLSAAMDAYGIKVRKPSADEIKRLVAEAGYPDSSSVSRAEFESIYLRVLQHAAAVSATAAAQRCAAGGQHACVR